MNYTREQLADALDEAADRIEKQGWTQGTYERPDGSVCALGAIRQALSKDVHIETLEGYERLNQLDRVVRQVLREQYGINLTVSRWNDSEDRTKQEVLDVLRAAAKEARK